MVSVERLKIAAKNGDAETIDNYRGLLMADEKLMQSVFNLAVRHSHAQIVKKLIDLGADLNYRGKYGWTALMRAVDARRFEVVKYLVSCGADARLKDRLGRSAADLARNKNYIEMAGILDF